ncbi:MAG TPA: hypothetical protein DCE81_12145 [Cytophagales bacterium]|nr:hypothetical protein [Cytophagales bacterium]
MATDIDVLIIYAEKDNETAKKGDTGWVGHFKHFLELMLFQVLGTKPNVVMKSEFDSATSPTLDNVSVMVAVLTRDFTQSGRCLDALETFHKASQDSPFSRLFKVLKSPLPIAEHPPRLRYLLGYDMYQQDIETGQIKEYSDFFSEEAERQYWMKMVDLAYDIHESLLMLRQGENKTGARNIFKRKTIYLAETGHDLSVQRNIIKRELQRHGYIVLPSATLPAQVGELEHAVRKDMESSVYSIHLIGTAYGEIPEGSDRSVVDIQNQLATEITAERHARGEDFARLIWIAPNLRNASERQKTFIDTIKRDTEAQDGTEILQNPLEDFKNIMREELLESDVRKGPADTAARSIYMVYDRVDAQQAEPIREMIEKSGFKVLTPAFEGDLLDVRKKHIENLRSFDGAVIFKGKVNDQWVRMKVLDLLKAPGFGRRKPIQGKALVTEAGTNVEAYKNQNLTLISGDSSRSMENLKNFLQDIKA